MVSERFEEPQGRKMPKYDKLPIHARANFENLGYSHLYGAANFSPGHQKLANAMN